MGMLFPPQIGLRSYLSQYVVRYIYVAGSKKEWTLYLHHLQKEGHLMSGATDTNYRVVPPVDSRIRSRFHRRPEQRPPGCRYRRIR